MYIIAGLGNPGKKYENTRHNIGFITLDYLAERHDIKINKIKHKALVGEGRISGQKVLLVKPQTYMNLSGESLREVMATLPQRASSPLRKSPPSEYTVRSVPTSSLSIGRELVRTVTLL